MTSGVKWVIVASNPDGWDWQVRRTERAEVFLGEYFHSFDDKGRVVMPSNFRRPLENGCVVAKGQDKQLVIFAVEDFEKRAGEVVERPQDKHGRRFSRTVFGGADLQSLDKSGRVLVKPDLRQFAELITGHEIAVVGVFDHIELWEKGTYLSDRSKGDEVYLDEEA